MKDNYIKQMLIMFLLAVALMVKAQDNKVISESVKETNVAKKIIGASRKETPVVAPSTSKILNNTISSDKRQRKFGPKYNRLNSKNLAKERLISAPLQVFLGLLFVIGCLFLFFFLLKKYGSRFTGMNTGTGLRVIQRIQLDSKNSVVLVGLHEEELLLGINNTSGINLLTKVARIDIDPDEVENHPETELPEKKDDASLLSSFQAKIDSEELK
jgi:flagellar biogenesis protein FliO